LQELQREIQTVRNARLVGQEQELLVNGKSKRENQWLGQTSSHKVTNFTSPEKDLLGHYVKVRITSAGPNSLAGEQVG